MALLDAIANNITTVADGDLFYSAEDLTGSYQDGKVAASVLKSYVLKSPVAVVADGTSGASIRLPEDTDNGSNYVALKAPDSLAATYTLTLPSDDGTSGQYLKTDGSGGLSWDTPAGGASAPLTLASGTITDSSPALTITQTWNDAADTFVAASIDITNTASADGSILLRGRVPASGNAGFEFAHRAPNNGSVLTLTDIYGGTGKIGNFSNIVGIAGGSSNYGLSLVPSGGSGAGLYLASDYPLSFGTAAAGNVQATRDLSLHRIGAGVLGVRGAASTNGAALNFLEQTAPSAPSSNQVVVYAEDNGSGKTRLMALFPTGAAQVLATEP